MSTSLLFWIGVTLISASILAGVSFGCAGSRVFTPLGCS